MGWFRRIALCVNYCGCLVVFGCFSGLLFCVLVFHLLLIVFDFVIVLVLFVVCVYLIVLTRVCSLLVGLFFWVLVVC